MFFSSNSTSFMFLVFSLFSFLFWYKFAFSVGSENHTYNFLSYCLLVWTFFFCWNNRIFLWIVSTQNNSEWVRKHSDDGKPGMWIRHDTRCTGFQHGLIQFWGYVSDPNHWGFITVGRELTRGVYGWIMFIIYRACIQIILFHGRWIQFLRKYFWNRPIEVLPQVDLVTPWRIRLN